MHSYQADHQRLVWAAVDAWNAAVPVGTEVQVETGMIGQPVRTKTAGAAYDEGHRALILVECSQVPVSLSNVKVISQ